MRRLYVIIMLLASTIGAPDPPATPVSNPNPKGCQDCIAQ